MDTRVIDKGVDSPKHGLAAGTAIAPQRPDWTIDQGWERYTDAERHITRGLDIARRSGQLHVLPHLLTSRAFLHLNTCRLPSALEAAEEAESIARSAGSRDLLAFTLAIKTLVLLLASPWPA